MSLNQNAGYGQLIAQTATMPTLWKTFYVTSTTGLNAQTLQDLFPVDNDGVVRVYSSITLALAACVANRGDAVIIMPDYTTAPTDTELWSVGTKWVMLTFAALWWNDEQLAVTSNKVLPATTTGSLFNVVGLCEVVAIIWICTTVCSATATNLKLATVSNSATTDICADLAIASLLAQSRFSITGTFANAMINTLKWVPVARQATPIVVQEGTIAAITSGTNTGAVRWSVRYRPLTPWARIYPA